METYYLYYRYAWNVYWCEKGILKAYISLSISATLGVGQDAEKLLSDALVSQLLDPQCYILSKIGLFL